MWFFIFFDKLEFQFTVSVRMDEKLKAMLGSMASKPDLDENDLKDLAALEQMFSSSSSQSSVSLPGGRAVMGDKGLEQVQSGITITPSPAFVVKSKFLDPPQNGFQYKSELLHGEVDQKVLVNVCTHEDIGVPAVKKRLQDGKEVEGLNIPMSVGPMRKCTDKSGVECFVCDIIVNPAVIKEALEDESGQQRDFICQLVLQSVEQKYTCSTDRRYKLPKLLYMGGDVQSQYIRDVKAAPKIEEISCSDTVEAPSRIKPVEKRIDDVILIPIPCSLYWIRSTSSSAFEEIALDGWDAYLEPVQTPPPGVTKILLRADLSDIQYEKKVTEDALAEAVDVEISPYKMHVSVPAFKQCIVHFPCAVSPCDVQSSLSRVVDGYVRLEIEMSIDFSCWSDDCDAGSKPWLVRQALSSHDNAENSSASSSSSSSSSASLYAHATARRTPQDEQYCDSAIVDNSSSSDELPEDAFHKKDAMSSYIIGQREEAVKDKWAKHEK